MEVVGTPCSLRSHQSMPSFFGSGPGPNKSNNYPLTSTETEAAEQSMDEYLRAIRRGLLATKVMKSPWNLSEGTPRVAAKKRTTKTEVMFAPGPYHSPRVVVLSGCSRHPTWPRMGNDDRPWV